MEQPEAYDYILYFFYNLKSIVALLQEYHPLSNVDTADQIPSSGPHRVVGDNIQNLPVFDEVYTLYPCAIAPVDT